jgi:glycosyltransferase involved in cell wall biosynthesis
VLFVGRLQTRKRVDALLAACDGVEPAPEVWIVGEGPARAALERLAQRGRLSVRFHGGLHGAALEQVYREADLFVLPGTGGLAVQEAMAHGLPVIVAEGDGTQADLVRPENGWLIPSEDAAALRQALRTALADPAGLRHKGEASHRIVAQEANIEVMAGEFVRALNQTRAAGG